MQYTHTIEYCSAVKPTKPHNMDGSQKEARYVGSTLQDFPGGSDGKESACNARDWSSVPGSGRSPGEGNGNPLQYSCLENPMDWTLVGCSPQGRKELDTTEQLTLSYTLCEIPFI